MIQMDLFGGELPVQKPVAPKLTEKPKTIAVANKEVDTVTVESNITIPPDEHLDQKLYYPISEVATMFQVNISLLRFWEKEFDILKPRKNRKGDRLFRPEDIRNLKMIHFLLKEKGYTIKGAKAFIKKGKKADVKFEAIESLKKLKEMLIELKSGLI
jgi:DNA-binding transcriptional MerR regulator